MAGLFEKVKGFLRKPVPVSAPRFLREWIGRWKYRRKEARFGKKYPNIDAEVSPAMERLTNQLIDETVGSSGIITLDLERKLDHYSLQVPLSRPMAEEMLVAALKVAVSRRKLLNERLASSVEIGSLYQSYFGRMQLLSSQMVDAYEKMEHMHRAENSYKKWQQIHAQVWNRTYEEGIRPPQSEQEEIPVRDKDMLKALNREGG